MGIRDLTDLTAVESAMREFDVLGRDSFLIKHGFAQSLDYFVVSKGKRYDSKAIAGVAHAYQHGEPLAAASFTGGANTVAKQLERLGFEVTRRSISPDWSIDELMMALDLYLRTRGTVHYSRGIDVVKSLSAELRSLQVFPESVRSNPRFRNANGVALKLHNFAAIDPDYRGRGMGHGSSLDARVWREWGYRADELHAAVGQIRARGRSLDPAPETGEEEEYAASEGRILYREHRRFERDRTLVARKKAEALRRTGRLACEVCDFESSESTGIPGVVDVHHIVPLHTIGESVTTMRDLALVCPTCHRLLHRHRPVLTPHQLRERFRGLQ